MVDQSTEESDAGVDEETPHPIDASQSQSTRSHLKWTTVFAAVMLFGTCIVLNASWLSVRTRADVVLLLPAIQMFAALLIVRFCGMPKGRFAWVFVVLLHAVIYTNTMLIQHGIQRRIMVIGAALLLRLLLIGSAMAIVAALATLLETVRRGNSRWSRCVPRILKVGLASALLLFPMEFAAKTILASRTIELTLPNNLQPSESINIATLGGSTMLGFPYAPHYGIGRIVVWQLQQMYPEREVVLNNISETGANLEQAISQLSQLKVLPDVLVVYSGHNEFFHNLEELALAKKARWRGIDDVLGYSALFRLLNGVVSQYFLSFPAAESTRNLVGEKLAHQDLLDARLLRYRQQLELLFAWAKSNRVSVVFCSPAACEADFEPNASFAASNVPETQRLIAERWQEIRDLQRQKEWEAAAEACRQGLRDHPDFAEFHFRLGECLRELRETTEANVHFRAALNKDQFPIRCLTAYREAGLNVAAEQNFTTLNCAEFLLQHSKSGFLDDGLFLDGVHPNLKATWILGRAVTDLIIQNDLLRNAGETVVAAERQTFAESIPDLEVDAKVLADAYATTSGVLKTYSGFRPYDTDRRISAAEHFKSLSHRLKNEDLQPGQDGSESLDQRVVYRGLPTSVGQRSPIP